MEKAPEATSYREEHGAIKAELKHEHEAQAQTKQNGIAKTTKKFRSWIDNIQLQDDKHHTGHMTGQSSR